MRDMLRESKDEDNRKRDEAQFYSFQQQLDELRRQLKENLARQQWFEELYKQNETKVGQVQTAQDRLLQDVAQAMHTRQVEDGRMKAQIVELVQRIDSPEKQLKVIRSQIQELVDGRKTDRDVDISNQQQIEELERQIREINSHIGQVGDSQRQLRDLIQELDSAIGEVRQEGLHLAELQSMEEQRLRRQGVELQGLFEAMRQQFADVSAKSQRVDDVRRQLTERVEAMEDRMGVVSTDEDSLRTDLDRVEKTSNEQYLLQQERLETVRIQIETQLSEMRAVNDQRMDRIMGRFSSIDERLRAIEQMMAEMPSRFEALERRDEALGNEADTIEEWLVSRQMTALEHMLEDVRKRKAERTATFNPNSKTAPNSAPGSVYNPAGLLKRVRDAKPPRKRTED
jgi:chromosome segregation ATPase